MVSVIYVESLLLHATREIVDMKFYVYDFIKLHVHVCNSSFDLYGFQSRLQISGENENNDKNFYFLPFQITKY